jgi:group I intron endonuclease
MIKQDSGEIYMITNKINNKKYIGQTVSYLSSGRKYGIYRRWSKHLSDAKNNADNGIRHFCNAIRKYGKDNFKIELLLICNLKMMDYYEKEFINLYDTISPKGYNLEAGGTNKDEKRLHEETKEKLSKSQRFLNMKDEDKENLLISME